MQLPKTRVKLRGLVAGLIDQERAHGVIAVFEQGGADYRLSFVAKEAIIEDGEFKTRETPAKRYTYLLGPGETCRTAAERLHALSQKSELKLDDVTDAFSVEKLNKEFYRAIQKHFYELVGGKVEKADYIGCMSLPSLPITAPENHKAYQEFAVRLLGRVVFCWFLKHKRCNEDRPLIPHELLSSEAVEKHSGYYHAVLEKLFFQTLNKPMNERSKYAPEFAHLIPYLNGGLFEPHSGDYYEEGSLGISRYANTLTLPDDWFLKLFQTLEMYNFTIDENTALDNDVSIDPEILGRIFENLLAEINPETGDSARKATGSFYTPREIVDYMVEESLIQHLKTALGIATKNTKTHKNEPIRDDSCEFVGNDLEQQLRALFVDDAEPHNLDDKTRRAVVNAFRTIKVLDPACGSGAFPVGILQKMLCALRKVDPENDLWLTAQIEQIHSMKLSKQEEDRRLAEIEHAFETNEADYGRKLGIIQNSVYGVDIQPIAIEISKLRFFLTLVVDEKINEKEDNRGILPLPNLDFKFVCANTLIPAPEIENKGELDLEYYPDFFKDFTLLTEQYFYAGTPAEKQRIRTKLSECVHKKVKGELDKVQMIQGNDLLENASLSAAKRKAIAERRKEIIRSVTLWRSYENIFTGETVGFFDPKYMFPDAGEGFDVVIANPPYGLVGSDQPAARAYYTSGRFKLLSYKINLYLLFLERGLELLNQPTSILSYIIPKSLVFNSYFESARKILLTKYSIPLIVEITEKVFDAAEVGDSVLFFARACTPTPESKLEYKIVKTVDINNDPGLIEITQQTKLAQTIGVQFRLPSFQTKVAHKLENLWKVSNGLNPGNVKHVLLSTSCVSPKHRKMVLGRDIQRYSLQWSGTWVNFDPSLKEKIKPSETKSKKGMTAQSRVDFALRSPEIYTANKILVRKTADHIVACLDFEDFCFDSLSYGIQAKDQRFSLKFLVGLLNSKFIDKVHGDLSQNKNKTFAKVLAKNLQRLPVPDLNLDDCKDLGKHDAVVAVVDQILAAKKENPDADVSALETKIDQLVYKLYNLTDEEIRIIDPDYLPNVSSLSAEQIDEGKWVMSMLAYLYVSKEDLVSIEEMTMVQILIEDDDLRKRVLKGGKKQSATPGKRLPDVDKLWTKYSSDQFRLIETPDEKAVGLGPKAAPLSQIETNKIGQDIILKAKEASAAIAKINKTCKTPEECFVVLERVYEPVRNV